MPLVWLLILLVAVVLLLPTLADAGMLAVLAWRSMRPGSGVKGEGARRSLPRILFLVPAHDEELLLGRCLRSVRALAYPADSFEATVVADNCSDGTADVALHHGVPCLVRQDDARRGKPWAVAWALERIDLARFEAVVVLDADSRVSEDYATALASMGPLRDKVVQGYNDVVNAGESNLTRMAAVFSAARCLRMNGLKQRATLNVPLGNGFCMGVGILKRLGWRAFSICEDWELYAQLTVKGVRIENQPRARVHSQEARTLGQSSSQRRRWTAGKMQVLMDQAGPILESRKIGRLQKLDALGELLSPGPAVHLGVASLLVLGSFASGVPGAALLAGLLLVPLARLGAYTGLALTDVEKPGRALAAFLTLPGYAVWRLGVQASALIGGVRGGWTRTARHREA